MVRFGYKSKELMDFLGAEIIKPKQQLDLFAESEPLEMPVDAILLDTQSICSDSEKQQGQRQEKWPAAV